MIYRAEILGKVPYGLTWNDVYASVISMVGEKTILESSSKRRLAGGMVSVIVTYNALNETEAKATVAYAARGVTNFSADIIGPKEVK